MGLSITQINSILVAELVYHLECGDFVILLEYLQLWFVYRGVKSATDLFYNVLLYSTLILVHLLLVDSHCIVFHGAQEIHP